MGQTTPESMATDLSTLSDHQASWMRDLDTRIQRLACRVNGCLHPPREDWRRRQIVRNAVSEVHEFERWLTTTNPLDEHEQ